MNIGYIYKITNLINGKMYVGQTTKTIEERFRLHIYDSVRKDKRDDNYPLYKAMKKYGINNFQIECIEECPISKLNEREIFWINSLNTYKNGYNATLGGGGFLKLNLDEEEIINEYNDLKTIKKVANIHNCSSSTIKKILEKHDIEIISAIEHQKNKGYIIYQYSLNNKLLNVFKCKSEIGEWLIKNNLSKSKNPLYAAETIYSRLRIGHNISFGYIWKLESDYDLSYKIQRKHKNNEIAMTNYYKKKKSNPHYKKDICPLCNKNEKLQSSTYCVECSQKLLSEQFTKEREQKISREELKQLIRTTPFTKIGEQFGVSDNAIRKWCTRYDLPTKSSEIKKYTNEEWENI